MLYPAGKKRKCRFLLKDRGISRSRASSATEAMVIPFQDSGMAEMAEKYHRRLFSARSIWIHS